TAAESREPGERPPVQGLLFERVLCPLLSGALRIACGPGDAERLDPGAAALSDLQEDLVVANFQHGEAGLGGRSGDLRLPASRALAWGSSLGGRGMSCARGGGRGVGPRCRPLVGRRKCGQRRRSLPVRDARRGHGKVVRYPQLSRSSIFFVLVY